MEREQERKPLPCFAHLVQDVMRYGRRTKQATRTGNDRKEAKAAVQAAEGDDSHVEIRALMECSIERNTQSPNAA